MPSSSAWVVDRLSSERLLVALTLSAGAVRTIFVDVRGEIADAAIAEVTRVLNDRLAGLSLRQVRSSLGDRLRDVGPTPGASDLLNVFIEEGDQLFDSGLDNNDDTLLLGQASVLAEQPEFASVDNMRKLVALTETREKLGELLRRRARRVCVEYHRQRATTRGSRALQLSRFVPCGPLTASSVSSVRLACRTTRSSRS